MSDAKAVPIAKPSGRLCTSSTPKTSSERRTPAPRSSPTWTSRFSSTPPRHQQERRSRPRGPRPRLTPPSSSSAGSSRPTTDATPIRPTVVPQRSGRSRTARSPSRNTGTAPRPVARAVALPASASTDDVHRLPSGRSGRCRARSGRAPRGVDTPQLLLDVGAVRLDRADAQEQLLGDLVVRVAERDQAQDLELPFASGRASGPAGPPGAAAMRAPSSGLSQVPPPAAALIAWTSSVPAELLEHVAARARAQRLAREGGVLLHGQDDDGRVGRGLGDLRDGLQARAAGHVEVEHEHGRLVAERVAPRRVDVAGLGQRPRCPARPRAACEARSARRSDRRRARS